MEEYLKTIPDWEKKAPVRFATFRDRDTDEDWHKKVDFWRKVLSESSARGALGPHLLCLEGEGLQNKFVVAGKTPQGLATVINEMVAKKELQALDAFARPARSWASWAYDDIFKSSLAWGISMLGFGGSATNLQPQGTYVFLEQTKTVALKVYEAHISQVAYSTDNVMGFEEVWNKYAAVPFQGLKLSHLDVEVVLMWLEAEKRVVVKKAPDGTKIVKFLNAHDKLQVRQITTVDSGVYSLKQSLATMARQMADLEGKIESCTQSAKENLQKGSKDKALYHLKRRKFVEGILGKRHAATENLEDILFRIQSAETNQQVTQAYESGKAALEAILAKGPSSETVGELLDDVRDLFVASDEVQAALSTGLDDSHDEDLERELQEIVESQAQVEDQQRQQSPPTMVPVSSLEDLPSPPASSPLKGSEKKKEPMLA